MLYAVVRLCSTLLAVPSLTIIYASGSGHTKYVLDVLMQKWKTQSPGLSVNVVRAETAKPEDLASGEVLLLACGSWNTGGVEGQLHPFMYDYLKGRAKDVDMKGKPFGIIALGDQRYFYTARAGEHLRSFAQTHGGKMVGQTLTIINEPYGQETKIEQWAEKFLTLIPT